MILAHIIATGEDDFVCDLAEYYGILNYKELSPWLVATLCCGLPDNSRTKKKITKQKLTLIEMLLSLLVDGINIMIWQKTKDGAKGRNKPESLFRKLLDLDKKQKDELQSFTSVDDFEAWYKDKHHRG